MTAWLFYVFAAIAVIFSLAVILLRNPVTSAFSLVVSFFAVAGIYVVLNATFLASIQVLVYTGAILVLFLYVTMLLGLRHESPPSRAVKALQVGALAALPLIVGAAVGLLRPFPDAGKDVKNFGSPLEVADLLLGGTWGFVFEAISLILLAAIVGVVLLSVQKKSRKEGT